MNNYVFGNRSKKVLDTLHPDLRLIAELAITRSNVDFGLHEGARSIKRQQECFDKGTSKINPSSYNTPQELAAVAKHIVIDGHLVYGKSRAFDFHVAETYQRKSLTWHKVHLAYIVGVLQSCAKELYDKKKISHHLRSGIDWDSDGVLMFDQKFVDAPHVELLIV